MNERIAMVDSIDAINPHTLIAPANADGIRIVIEAERGPNNWPVITLTGPADALRAFMAKHFDWTDLEWEEFATVI